MGTLGDSRGWCSPHASFLSLFHLPSGLSSGAASSRKPSRSLFVALSFTLLVSLCPGSCWRAPTCLLAPASSQQVWREGWRLLDMVGGLLLQVLPRPGWSPKMPCSWWGEVLRALLPIFALSPGGESLHPASFHCAPPHPECHPSENSVGAAGAETRQSLQVPDEKAAPRHAGPRKETGRGFIFTASYKENKSINMLKISYFYFKRTKTAQTNTELMERSWL